jgi:hypothetical protein
MKKIVFVFLAVMVLPFFAERISACSCIHHITVCEAYQTYSAVFVGKVLDSKRISAQYEYPDTLGNKKTFTLYSKVYRISIEQVFKGVKGSEIELTTNDNGSDCGYPFNVGERYLIYAHFVDTANQYTTSVCTRTKLYSKASEDLDYIRNLPESATKTRVSGTVVRDGSSQPLSGIKVVIAGAERYEVFTNSDGVYQVVGLPPGDYRVWAVFPDQRTTIERIVTVPAGGCDTQDIVGRPK